MKKADTDGCYRSNSGNLSSDIHHEIEIKPEQIQGPTLFNDCLEIVKTEDVEEVPCVDNLLSKGGFDCEQVNIKLEDTSSEIRCDEGLRGYTVTRDEQCDIDVKQEVDATDEVKEEIWECSESLDVNEKLDEQKDSSCEVINEEFIVEKEISICMGDNCLYQCKVCDFKTKSMPYLKYHVITGHDKEAEWCQCQACDYRAEDRRNLNKHFTVKHGNETTEHDKEAKWYHCQACDYRAKDKRLLNKQFTVKHDKETEWYQCEASDYRIKYEYEMRQHFIVKHDKRAEWYQCQTCDYRTKYKKAWITHTVNHVKEAEWYQCQACDYKTKDRSSYHRHFTVKHNKEAILYNCQTCDYRTKDRSNWRRHFRGKHHKKRKELPQTILTQSETHRFQSILPRLL